MVSSATLMFLKIFLSFIDRGLSRLWPGVGFGEDTNLIKIIILAYLKLWKIIH
jgi:hypothetical protein